MHGEAAIGPTWPVLFLEPFYGGSHKQLVDLLVEEFGGDLYTLPASKWHWRSRVAALNFLYMLPFHHDYQVLFCSSVLNLCELVALRPELAVLRKVYYFHENQLVYPVRKQQDRDFQYGYNQILSCLVADCVVFNSHYNMHSFLDGIDTHLRLIPDIRPRGLAEQIRPKCCVLYFPLELPLQIAPTPGHSLRETRVKDSDDVSQVVQPLHIVWPHRWEHDKGPDEFCEVLLKLSEAGKDFTVSFLGSHTADIPESIRMARSLLGKHVLHYGPLPREQYWQVLHKADIAVSTAKHEFFGVAMMEAMMCGCYPLCPNGLVYPELYPKDCLYNTEQQLYKKLSGYCDRPWNIPQVKSKINYSLFTWTKLKQDYLKLISISFTGSTQA